MLQLIHPFPPLLLGLRRGLIHIRGFPAFLLLRHTRQTLFGVRGSFRRSDGLAARASVSRWVVVGELGFGGGFVGVGGEFGLFGRWGGGLGWDFGGGVRGAVEG